MKNRILKKIMMLALLTTVAFSTEHYVDNTYSGNSDGSEERPWKTLNDINILLSDGLHEGDKVFFHRGQTFRGTLKFDNKNNNVEFNSYGSGDKAVISSYIPNDELPMNISELRIEDNYYFALKINSSSNITIKNLEFIGMYASIQIINGSHNIILDSLKIGKDSLNGIVIGSNPKSSEEDENSNDINNITIKNCNIINEFSMFQHDKRDNSGDYNDKEDYMQTLTEDGIVVYSMQHSTISNNYFKDWGIQV